MFSVPLQPGENQGASLGEFKSRSAKAQDAVKGFHLLETSHKLCQGFHQAMNTRKNMFFFVYKMMYKTMYKACMYAFDSFVKL